MINFSEAKRIEFGDYDKLSVYLQGFNTPSCEMSFANLKMWSEVYHTQFVAYGENYLFFSADDGIIYFPRYRDLLLTELCEIADDFKSFYGLDEVIIYDVDSSFVEKNPEITEFFAVEFDEDDYDYLYLNQQLATMSGGILKKKRNLINQFEKAYPDYFVETIDSKNASECYSFAITLNNLLEQTEFVGEENQSMKYAFENFEKLFLNGFVLYAEKDLPVGFTVFSALNEDYADIHFEKARHDIKGAPQILVQLLARELLSKGFKYMNREQDLGSEGIRQAKKSLAPIGFYQRVRLKK